MPRVSAEETPLEQIRGWRDMYRVEMSCQIVHDSIHDRAGWTREYVLSLAGTPVGYGSLAVGGPWRDKPTLYEFYVVPHHRLRMFDLFRALLAASGAVSIEVQSNDPLATVMCHTFAGGVASEAILFEDSQVTSHVARWRQRSVSPLRPKLLTCTLKTDVTVVSSKLTAWWRRPAASCFTTTVRTVTSSWTSRSHFVEGESVLFWCRN